MELSQIVNYSYRKIKKTKEEIDKYIKDFRQRRKESCLNTILLTWIKEWIFSEKGLYGDTVRHSGKIRMNDDLNFNYEEKIDTDMHESGHTEWEYETREKTKVRREILFPEKRDYKVGLVPEYRV